MFENAKVGDKVYDLRYGWGEVVRISYKDTLPVHVRFKDGYDAYYKCNGNVNKDE